MTTVGVPRVLKCTGVYLGWYLAYLRILYQVPPRTKLNHEVGGAIHTSEVAVNGRSASPWAAAGTAAARVRSSKVYGLRSKGILLAKEGNGDLSEVSGEHHKAWRMCYMRCEHLFTPLTDPIIPVAPDPPWKPRGSNSVCTGLTGPCARKASFLLLRVLLLIERHRPGKCLRPSRPRVEPNCRYNERACVCNAAVGQHEASEGHLRDAAVRTGRRAGERASGARPRSR